jgi:beta-glucosidase
VYRDAQRPIEERVDDLLSRMTLEEKVAQLGSLWIYEIADDEGLNRPWAQRAWRTGWVR